MQKESVINIVAIEVKPESEAKFNRWMEEVHIPMLLKFKGLVKASRFKGLSSDTKGLHYITQYEFESQKAFESYEKSPELNAAKEEMQQSWPDGGIQLKSRTAYRFVRTLP